jgi:hypothetical protein
VLRHCATSLKDSSSIPDVIDLFNVPNPSSRTMALKSTQPVTEISTRNFSGNKGRSARQAGNLTAIHEPIVLRKCVSLDVSQPYGPSRPVRRAALSCRWCCLLVVQLPDSNQSECTFAAGGYQGPGMLILPLLFLFEAAAPSEAAGMSLFPVV